MYIMYLKLRLTVFSFSAMKVYYLHVVRDALHANMLGLSEPRVDMGCDQCQNWVFCNRVHSLNSGAQSSK